MQICICRLMHVKNKEYRKKDWMERKGWIWVGFKRYCEQGKSHVPMLQKCHCTHLRSLSPPCMDHQFLFSLDRHSTPPWGLYLHPLESGWPVSTLTSWTQGKWCRPVLGLVFKSLRKLLLWEAHNIWRCYVYVASLTFQLSSPASDWYECTI